jgi:hypothetical protein
MIFIPLLFIILRSFRSLVDVLYKYELRETGTPGPRKVA